MFRYGLALAATLTAVQAEIPSTPLVAQFALERDSSRIFWGADLDTVIERAGVDTLNLPSKVELFSYSDASGQGKYYTDLGYYACQCIQGLGGTLNIDACGGKVIFEAPCTHFWSDTCVQDDLIVAHQPELEECNKYCDGTVTYSTVNPGCKAVMLCTKESGVYQWKVIAGPVGASCPDDE